MHGVLPRHQRAEGAALLHATPGGIARLHQKAPLRFLFPAPEPDEPLQAALVNTAGGLAGGDEVGATVTLAPGAAALVTTPAAEKIYRSLGPAVRVTNRIEVAEGAMLEWVPQETILFDGAVLERRTHARVAPGGVLLAAEALVLGRIASGETWRVGRVLDSWRLHLGERLAWAEGFGCEATARDAPFGLDGAQSLGLVLLAIEEAGRHRELGRELTNGAATLLRPNLLLLRFLGDAQSVRSGIAAALPALRAAALNRPARLPRLWTC
jgi:urease accessory protein